MGTRTSSPPDSHASASRRPAAGVPFALAAAVCSIVGYFAMFTDFAPWDDSGYLLLGLRQYIEGGVLYDQLYTQYGPAYFQLVGAVFGALGVELTHAVARAVVLAVWLATSVTVGVAAYRLTRLLPVALVCQLLTFLVLVPSRNEPMHPGSSLALAVSLIVLAGTRLRTGNEWGALAAIGGLIALAGLTKANVGVFALVAVVFVLAAATQWSRGTTPITVAAGLAAVLVPAACMAARLEDGRVQVFLAVMTCSVLAIVLTHVTTVARTLPVRALALLIGTGVAVALASCALALGRGTSLAGLVHGVIVDPLRTPGVFFFPLRLASWATAAALASLVAAATVVVLRRRGPSGWPIAPALDGSIRLLGGAAMWLAAAGLLPAGPFSVSLPLLWLPLAARPSEGAAPFEIGRALLVAMAVMQALVAYPIAGSQAAWASFLFVPVGGMAVADGWRALRLLPAPGRWQTGSLWRTAEVALGVTVVGLALHVAVVMPLASFRYRYATSEPLALHGAGSIRVPPPTALAYQRLTSQLTERCRGFVTMPGLNSLYLFARVAPPTMLNTTSWMTLFDDERQAAIQQRLAQMPGPLCAVRHRGLVAFWAQGRDVSGEPLARYIDARFVTEFTVHGYEFMVERRRDPSHASAGVPSPRPTR